MVVLHTFVSTTPSRIVSGINELSRRWNKLRHIITPMLTPCEILAKVALWACYVVIVLVKIWCSVFNCNIIWLSFYFLWSQIHQHRHHCLAFLPRMPHSSFRSYAHRCSELVELLSSPRGGYCWYWCSILCWLSIYEIHHKAVVCLTLKNE